MDYSKSPYWQPYAPPSIEVQDAKIAGLKSALKAFADGFAKTYGLPAALVCAEPIWGKVRERALRWLHDMTCMARRMILMRAMQMPRPEGVPEIVPVAEKAPLRCVRPREGTEAQLLAGSKDPAHWRVRFSPGAPYDSTWLKTDPQYKNTRALKAKLVMTYDDDPRPLAEKFEAILRVIEDPDYYAAQFAKRLHRWKGRAYRLEKFLAAMAMASAMMIFNEADLDDAALAQGAGSTEIVQNMIPQYLRIESG